jgi:hypothetical protein
MKVKSKNEWIINLECETLNLKPGTWNLKPGQVLKGIKHQTAIEPSAKALHVKAIFQFFQHWYLMTAAI